ncbi:phosphatases II [Xylariaceae sp. FL0255]|nr:phosphatases II [Xylariaceae sp. FL0255]
MVAMSKIPGVDNLFVGGIWALSVTPYRKTLTENHITHVLSVIKYSFENWGEEAKRFKHMSIDIDDDESSDLLGYFPAAVRFIESGLQGEGEEAEGGVYVHCAVGKSRSVSCVIAYLLYKYPERFGGINTSSATTQQRCETAKKAVQRALDCVREVRSIAEPNHGFSHQLELWWEMGCPASDDGAVERHPTYQKWLYDRMLSDARDMRMAPDAEQIRFEDEIKDGNETIVRGQDVSKQQEGGKEVRCKKCRRTLATPQFLVPHRATGCGHIFIETLSWMRPALEDGVLEGRLVCPNSKCGAIVGRFAWQGFECTCRQWVVPAFSLNRSRVDEVSAHRGAAAIRMPPGRYGSL